MSERVYLDNNGTTFLDPRVLKVLQKHQAENCGNPSSVHAEGRHSKALLIKARSSLAAFLKVKASEIIFTSGGTEGINMILRGIFGLNPQGHLITSSVEHAAVYSTAQTLSSHPNCTATFLSPGLHGAIHPKAIEIALRGDTKLIALMAVNNETGVKTDIDAIARLAKEANVPFMVDGVGLLGKESFQIPEGVSAMCFSGHKIHAPAGTGFVYVRSTLKFDPLLTGGGQEFGKRSGTENLPSILGLMEAVQIIAKEGEESMLKMRFLRDKLERDLKSFLPDVEINGEGERVSNTSNLSFAGVEGETLLSLLDLEGISVSHGSACSSGALEPSRVLLNMGLSKRRASSSIRISLSKFTTEQEIERAVNSIARIVKKIAK